MIIPDKLRSIGKFQRTHALQGELNAYLEVDDEYLLEHPWVIVEMEGIPTPFHVESVRPKGATTSLVKLTGVDTETKAKIFVNHEILTDGDNMQDYEEDDEDGFYASDFTGYLLKDAVEYKNIGVITGVNTASEDNPLFEVTTEGGREVLVPVAQELMREIDPDCKVLSMVIPDGLLDL